MISAQNRYAPRKRALTAALLATCLGLLVAACWPGSAGSAPARVVELGQTDTVERPTCPGRIVNGVEVEPCRVEGHVTGFQVKAGGVPNPYQAPFDGKIVAWSITLSRPARVDGPKTTNEVGFFNDFLGSPSMARISILRRIPRSKPPRYKLLRHSPLQILNQHFGTRPIFALEHPLTVLRGQVVALTIPTWAPMFAFNIGEDNTWRGSRAPGKCSSREDLQNGRPQQGIGKIKPYGCYYSAARLLYTATLVKTGA